MVDYGVQVPSKASLDWGLNAVKVAFVGRNPEILVSGTKEATISSPKYRVGRVHHPSYALIRNNIYIYGILILSPIS